MRQGLIGLVVILLGVIGGCERARPYPARLAIQTTEPTKPEPSKPIADVSWLEPKKPSELGPVVPIVFVPSTSPEWKKLPGFWTVTPSPQGLTAVALASSPIALPHLGVAASLHLAGPMQVKVRVPLGLPDPTPLLPAANPPTLAKWQLGKELFFEEMLRAEPGGRAFSCASCHQPKNHFTEKQAVATYMKFNTPTLINVVYNRHQFWDGRVRFLEEVVVRDLADETPPLTRERFARHSFGGFTSELRDQSQHYNRRFREVFGVGPTQDLVGKALATYMRTILSGNSYVDRAEERREAAGVKTLEASHFERLFADWPSEVAKFNQPTAAALAKQLEQGYKLFTGKANCAACHTWNGLFTDHDFHNVGLSKFNEFDDLGRLAHVPPGLKETRLHGAYRTPGLRNVVHTGPYMHDGANTGLQLDQRPEAAITNVLHFFNSRVDLHGKNRFLAAPLLDQSGNPRKLNLNDDEIHSIANLLRAMEGEPVDPMVTEAPNKKQ